MINSSIAEAYFIAAMMILIVILSTAATIFFVRQYKREKRENPLTRKNLADFQATREKNGQTSKPVIKQASKKANKQTEYVEK